MRRRSTDMSDEGPKDLPWTELVNKAMKLLRNPRVTLFGKWTCRGCGSRQTFEEHDRLFTSGICEECGFETSLVEHGGGLGVIFERPTEEDLRSVL
jgi:hypothetical protein